MVECNASIDLLPVVVFDFLLQSFTGQLCIISLELEYFGWGKGSFALADDGN